MPETILYYCWNLVSLIETVNHQKTHQIINGNKFLWFAILTKHAVIRALGSQPKQ